MVENRSRPPVRTSAAVGSSKTSSVGLVEQRPGDLHHLLLGRGQVANERVDRQGDVEAALERLAGVAAQAAAVDQGRTSQSRGSRPTNSASATVRVGASSRSWWMKWMPRRSSLRGRHVGMRDAVDLDRAASGAWMPASTLIRVDLPAPFWPTGRDVSPRSTVRDAPSSALTPPKRLTISGTRGRAETVMSLGLPERDLRLGRVRLGHQDRRDERGLRQVVVAGEIARDVSGGGLADQRRLLATTSPCRRVGILQQREDFGPAVDAVGLDLGAAGGDERLRRAELGDVPGRPDRLDLALRVFVEDSVIWVWAS